MVSVRDLIGVMRGKSWGVQRDVACEWCDVVYVKANVIMFMFIVVALECICNLSSRLIGRNRI